MKSSGDCHCLHLRDRPATTTLPSEESGSLRDRGELATTISTPLEKQGTQEWKLRTAMNISHPSSCCSSFIEPHEQESTRTGWNRRTPCCTSYPYHVVFRVVHFDACSDKLIPCTESRVHSRCYYFFLCFFFFINYYYYYYYYYYYLNRSVK